MAKKKTRSRRSAKSESGEPEAQTPEFPKKMARVRLGAGNAPETDVQTVENSEAESTLKEAGYFPLDDVLSEEPRPSYPAWRYHPDEGRRLVHSEEEDDALDGEWVDSPEGHEQAIPQETDLTRAHQTLGPQLSSKLDMVANHILGIPEAAKRADGNFDPSTVPIQKGQNPDAAVRNSNSTAAARSGKR